MIDWYIENYVQLAVWSEIISIPIALLAVLVLVILRLKERRKCNENDD